MQFNVVNNKEMPVFLVHWGPGWSGCLAVCGLRSHAQVHIGHAAQSSGYLEPHWEELSAAFVFSKRLSFFQR